MKARFLIFGLCFSMIPSLQAQQAPNQISYEQAIYSLIDEYSLAREESDTVLLKSILTSDVDQLVSTGEWRKGIRASVQGMKRSSESRPGSRILTIEKIRLLNPETAIVDARYEIENADHSIRKMWSTFIVVYQGKRWRITAIRNMLPAP